MPRGQKRAKALTGRSGKRHPDGVVREPGPAVALRDFVAEHRADGAVRVADERTELDRRPVLERRAAPRDQLVVERAHRCRDPARTPCGAPRSPADPAHAAAAPGRDRRLPVVDGRIDIQAIGTADHLVDRPEAELGHQLAHFLRDEPEEGLDELGLAGELLAQLRILRRDAHRAGVQVAHAHHHAAHHDERSRREAVLLGPEQRADDDIAARSSAGRPPARRCDRAAC